MTDKTLAQDRVPFWQKVAYGFGAFTNNLLSGAVGSMGLVLNLGLGMNPATIGLIMGSSRLTDALIDPVMGYVSDHTRTRWGRRRPFIVVGALISGLILALMWQMPAEHSQRFYFWFFLIGINLFYVAFTLFAAPFIALGYELTPDYHERIRIQGYSNIFGQIPWLLLSWSYAFMENKHLFATNVEGARMLAIIMGVTVAILGILPGIFCREPFYKVVLAHDEAQRNAAGFVPGLRRRVTEFFKAFFITLRERRFLKLAAATFLVFNGFMMISGLGPYIIIFYVFGGNQELGARYVGWFGTALSACTFGAIIVATWMATRWGKKRAFFISTGIAILGYVLKWFCYQPRFPLLIFIPAPFLAFGLGGLFTTVSAMIPDVCDADELQQGVRREGLFGAVYWWMVKLGMAVALVVSGHLLNATGFQQALGPNQLPHSLWLMRVFEVCLPILAYGLAIVSVSTYDLDQEKVEGIRVELEKRRGKTAVTTA